MAEVRYMHRTAPRACNKIYMIMRGPLTVDGGFQTDRTSFYQPEGDRCHCADGSKRVPADLHMLNPNEMAELGTVEKRGVEFIEVDIAMTKSDDDNDADGTPEIAEDTPLVEAKKPKPAAKRKPAAKKKPQPEPESQPEPWRTGFPTFGSDTHDAPKADEKPSDPASWTPPGSKDGE